MGGYGTYKFATQYPDLFARAQPRRRAARAGRLGAARAAAARRCRPATPTGCSASVRTRPLPDLGRRRGRAGAGRRARPPRRRPSTTSATATSSTSSRAPTTSRSRSTTSTRRSPTSSARTRSIATRRTSRYVVNPTMDFPERGTVADHAYWLSGLSLRDATGGAPLGRVDARSEAFGRGDPAAEPDPDRQPATLDGGNLGRCPSPSSKKTWGNAPHTPAHDVLHLDAQNLARADRPSRHAPSSPATRQLDVTTDGPLTVTLARLRPHAPLLAAALAGRAAGLPAGAAARSSSLSRLDGPLPRHLPGDRPGARRGHLRAAPPGAGASVGFVLAALAAIGGATAVRGLARATADHPAWPGWPVGRGDRRGRLRSRQRRRRGRPGARHERRLGDRDHRRPGGPRPRRAVAVRGAGRPDRARWRSSGSASARRRRAQRKYEGLRVLR